MSDFRTIMPPLTSSTTIGHEDRLLFLGSCFSDNIGQLLFDHLFQTTINPTGIIYHPANLATHLRHLYNPTKVADASKIAYKGNQAVHYDYHSTLHGSGEQQLVENINIGLQSLQKAITQADHIFITLGSAWGYHHTANNHFVANCHKQDASLFTRKLSTHQELVQDYNSIIDQIHEINPDCNIIFTVSPIRHIRYGMTENNLGKARLISALHENIEYQDHCAYFPAYELMMDDLRDYRFYEDDMLHPSKVAVDYIWQYFKQSYFTESTQQIDTKIAKLQQQLDHRIQSTDHSTIKQYVSKVITKVNNFKAEHPTVNTDIIDRKVDKLNGLLSK